MLAKDQSREPKPAPPAPPAPPARRRDIRPWIYATLDALAASLYAYVLFSVIPSRHAWVALASCLVVLAPLVMAGAMLYRRPWSWWAALGGCALLLVLTLVFLVLTLVSAAFLSGVYGPLGRAASALALIGAALVVQFMGLLPTFQLSYLMTRAGRRAFARKSVRP